MRKCSICGKPMVDGFYVDALMETGYYCSEECLTKVYTWDEYMEMYNDDCAYWTEWEEEE